MNSIPTYLEKLDVLHWMPQLLYRTCTPLEGVVNCYMGLVVKVVRSLQPGESPSRTVQTPPLRRSMDTEEREREGRRWNDCDWSTATHGPARAA